MFRACSIPCVLFCQHWLIRHTNTQMWWNTEQTNTLATEEYITLLHQCKSISPVQLQLRSMSSSAFGEQKDVEDIALRSIKDDAITQHVLFLFVLRCVVTFALTREHRGLLPSDAILDPHAAVSHTATDDGVKA